MSENKFLRRAPDGDVKWLVLFAHGYGSNGQDLMRFADLWAGAMPGVAFAAPCGPTPSPDGGFQWVPKRAPTDPRFAQEIAEAAVGFNALCDRELAHVGLDASRLAIVGFSQGTVLSLQAGLRRKIAPAAILGYAGGLIGRANLHDEITCRPPVMLINGEQDALAPVYGMQMAVKALSEAGLAVQGFAIPGLGHEVDADSLIMGGRFLLSAFAYREKHAIVVP